jgi:hypothetical protein
MSFFKRALNAVKKQGPSIFSGIKKGLAIGRIILDISQDVVDRIKQVDESLGNRLEQVVKSNTYKKLDNVVKTGQQISGNIDKLIQGNQGQRRELLNTPDFQSFTK